MPARYTVKVHPNEKQSPERIAALAWAIQRRQSLFEFGGYDSEIPADLLFQGPCKIYVEIKDRGEDGKPGGDLWGSKKGHLGDQANMLLEACQQGDLAFVAVLASQDEAEASCPWVTQIDGEARLRSEADRDRDVTSLEGLENDFEGVGVPVWYLSSDREKSYQRILGRVKGIFQGGNIGQWRTRFKVDPAGYGCLCSISGIGHESALGLLEQYESIDCIVTDCKFSPEDLANTKIKGKKLGRSKAGQIVRAFTGRYPEGWARA